MKLVKSAKIHVSLNGRRNQKRAAGDQNEAREVQQSYVSFTNIVDSNNGSFDIHSVKVLVQVHYPCSCFLSNNPKNRFLVYMASAGVLIQNSTTNKCKDTCFA